MIMFDRATRLCNISPHIAIINFAKFSNFNGRASRAEFWWFALFTLIGGIVTSVADVMILGYVSEDWGPLNIIFSIIWMVSSRCTRCIFLGYGYCY